MFNPISTYRIQFNKEFGFKALNRIIPYLKHLGIKTIYASPIFEALPGSMHGYDTINPHGINPEIGTEAELLSVVRKLHKNGISWIQDIVPNHMAYHPSNSWLMDVLEKGESSPYFKVFDLDFPTPVPGKLMVPFLGSNLENALDEHILKLVYDKGNIYLKQAENLWPVNPDTYIFLLNLIQSDSKVKILLGQIERNKHRGKNIDYLVEIKTLIRQNAIQKRLREVLSMINQDHLKLTEIIDAQYYRLCSWTETNSQINFRRFFTVNSLICLNMQEEEVFELYHRYIFELTNKGVFQGLRIDHVDGLFDPSTYLERLRSRLGESIYIVVEKILGEGEEMPDSWPVQGNTGYDFLSLLNNLLTNKNAEKAFDFSYQDFTGKKLNVSEQILLKKSEILYEHMHGELDNLYQLFLTVQPADVSLKIKDIKTAIARFLISCPVYRYYGNHFPLSGNEENAVKEILEQMAEEDNVLKPAVKVLKQIFLGKDQDESYLRKAQYFYQRLMQFSGPLMAKGVEDTLMYSYNRFIAHSEVGDRPDAFGLRTEIFHSHMVERAQQWPLSMNATATHDTKRGEGVRARLNVLTDIPEQWHALINQLKVLLQDSQPEDNPIDHLHPNDVFLIFQSVYGAMPMPGQEDRDFAFRLEQYLQKALREAKKRSDWASPDEDYEAKAKKFALLLLNKKSAPYQALYAFLEKTADYGILNSLVQVVLKMTCPGIPDIYQGTEFWDLSFVDPDNRRPVDYNLRKTAWKSLRNWNPDELWVNRNTGEIKLWLIQMLLMNRQHEAELYEKGMYLPLEVSGKYKKNILAFARELDGQYQLIAVPLGLASIVKDFERSLMEFDWEDTALVLPSGFSGHLQNIFTRDLISVDIADQTVQIQRLFNNFPFAVCKSEKVNPDRKGGVLLHITSLPSPYGIGDLGREAYAFADFLAEHKQYYWQLLPLNPISPKQYFSPYSSCSSMAGNVLLISPEKLVEAGLLQERDLKLMAPADAEEVDFTHAEKIKGLLLKKAYQNFKRIRNEELYSLFQNFCSKENYWLKDFASFMALKSIYEDKVWCNWPDRYKLRDEEALNKFISNHQEEIQEIKFQQFVFDLQWKELVSYTSKKNIQFIGDLPFYVDHDSVDVWANPQLFKLDDQFEVLAAAGVPPDYFNANGQLWGMPVFNWPAHKRTGYTWWKSRIERNLELFDLLRLDHFRAFDQYWEIPKTAETAKEGYWQNGPGVAFFKSLKAHFGALPFIAEDLGEAAESVEQLRRKVKLPGMKVLQFAFGEDLPGSFHIPHNYPDSQCVVYTGTHDNNTLLGWYLNDASPKDKVRLMKYLGKDVSKENVNELLIGLAYGSTAKMAIIPMQDILMLDEKSRMNTPASIEHNWMWSMRKDQYSKGFNWLIQLTKRYGRD